MVSGVMVVQKNFRSITSELILAVDEEIRAIKSSGGSDRVGVHAGEHCGEVGDGRFIYKFILDSELLVPTDTPGRLQVGNSSYEVAIVSIEDLAITLSTSKLITGSISTATLSFSPYYILDEHDHQYDSSREKPGCPCCFGDYGQDCQDGVEPPNPVPYVQPVHA
jgi:hypothetical protein